jgi:hypothetical protein
LQVLQQLHLQVAAKVAQALEVRKTAVMVVLAVGLITLIPLVLERQDKDLMQDWVLVGRVTLVVLEAGRGRLVWRQILMLAPMLVLGKFLVLQAQGFSMLVAALVGYIVMVVAQDKAVRVVVALVAGVQLHLLLV